MIEICSSHFDENLEWLKKSEFPVTVVHHEGGKEFPKFKETFVIPNEGYEASAYLEFIIQRYNTLPEYTAFIHGHEHAEHQRVPCMLQAIRNANKYKYSFIHLNNSFVYKQTSDSDNFVNVNKFSRYYEIPPIVHTSFGAQFIVHRDAIRSRSLDFYKKVREITKTKKDAMSLEFTWHIIFNSPGHPERDMFIPEIPIYYINTWTVPCPEKLTLRINYPPRDTSDPNMIFFETQGNFVIYQEKKFPIYLVFDLYKEIYNTSMRFNSVHTL